VLGRGRQEGKGGVAVSEGRGGKLGIEEKGSAFFAFLLSLLPATADALPCKAVHSKCEESFRSTSSSPSAFVPSSSLLERFLGHLASPRGTPSLRLRRHLRCPSSFADNRLCGRSQKSTRLHPHRDSFFPPNEERELRLLESSFRVTYRLSVLSSSFPQSRTGTRNSWEGARRLDVQRWCISLLLPSPSLHHSTISTASFTDSTHERYRH
jgi:hypothetical protein